MRAALAALAVLALATTARADDDDDKPQVKTMDFASQGDKLTFSTQPGNGIGTLFDPAAYERLSTGFPTTVVIRIQVTPADSDTPVAELQVERSVIYDLWEEVYNVQLESKRKFVVAKMADALVQLTTIKDMPIARLGALAPNRPFVVKIVAELNPLSNETLAGTQHALRQGTGGGVDRGGAFFGSFVSIFYNPKIAAAERVLRIRSQPFSRPAP